jgi:FHA domain-containing protein
MIRIEVVTYEGKPPSIELAADFDEMGGCIGRDPSCNLVLPDPEKRISRRHAEILLREGRYVLRDQGTALSARLNGRPIGAGLEVPLAEGDRIDIGGYSMRVTILPAAPAFDAGAGHVDESAPSADDLVASFGGGRAGVDPFADLAPKPSRAAGPARAPGSSRAETQPAREARWDAALPADFDPFAEPVEPPPAPLPGPRATDALGLELEPLAKAASVDELFGLKPGEPFPPGHPLAPRGAGGKESVDELLAGRRAKPHAEPVQRDDVPELHGTMKLPEGKAPPHRVPEVPADFVVSWEQAPGEGKVGEVKSVVIPSPPVAAPEDLPSRPQPSTPRREAERAAGSVAAAGGVHGGVQEGPAGTAAAGESVEPETASRGPASDPLLSAFLEGAGVPDVPVHGPMTPELMRSLGVLLRTATQGTLDLLRSRSAVKSEMHAEITMIAPRENNPLKFSPTVETALYHLLAPQGRGFLPPQRALQEAYQDLVSHQMGFAAGVRAALVATLTRFDPNELEKKLAAKSALDALLPALRKARLWDLYAQRFAEISGEAEEGFDEVFAREFVQAYQAQVAELSRATARQS